MTASPVPAIQVDNSHDREGGNAEGKGGKRRTATAAGTTHSGGGQGCGALAPCCDGGVTDTGGVGQILSRSLGKAAAAMRRNRPGEGSRERENSSGMAGARGGGVRSRWRSWNEPPPHALLTAEEIRKLSAGDGEDEARRGPPPSEVIAEVLPPFQSRRRFKNAAGNATTAAERNDGQTAASAPAGTASPAAGTLGNERRRGGGSSGEGGAPLSTASSAVSSRRISAGGGVPLVPRVATLAAAPVADSRRADPARKGKDFDPDQLECVRRHEASVAERERRVRSLRTEAEKRSQFRARPLPAFLESGGVAGPVGGVSSGSGGGGDIGYSNRSNRGLAGAAGTSPELLAALEQARRRVPNHRSRPAGLVVGVWCLVRRRL